MLPNDDIFSQPVPKWKYRCNFSIQLQVVCIVEAEIDFVDIITSGLTNEARFSFDSFIFGIDPEGQIQF